MFTKVLSILLLVGWEMTPKGLFTIAKSFSLWMTSKGVSQAFILSILSDISSFL